MRSSDRSLRSADGRVSAGEGVSQRARARGGVTHARETVDGVIVVCYSNLADALLRLGCGASERVEIRNVVRRLEKSYLDQCEDHAALLSLLYLVSLIVMPCTCNR